MGVPLLTSFIKKDVQNGFVHVDINEKIEQWKK